MIYWAEFVLIIYVIDIKICHIFLHNINFIVLLQRK